VKKRRAAIGTLDIHDRRRQELPAPRTVASTFGNLLNLIKLLCLLSVQSFFPHILILAKAIAELKSSEYLCSELCFSRFLCNSFSTFHLLWHRLIQLSDQLKAFSTPGNISREEALDITIRNLEKHHRNVKSVPSTLLHPHLRCSARHPPSLLIRPIFDTGLVRVQAHCF